MFFIFFFIVVAILSSGILEKRLVFMDIIIKVRKACIRVFMIKNSSSKIDFIVVKISVNVVIIYLFFLIILMVFVIIFFSG